MSCLRIVLSQKRQKLQFGGQIQLKNKTVGRLDDCRTGWVFDSTTFCCLDLQYLMNQCHGKCRTNTRRTNTKFLTNSKTSNAIYQQYQTPLEICSWQVMAQCTSNPWNLWLNWLQYNKMGLIFSNTKCIFTSNLSPATPISHASLPQA